MKPARRGRSVRGLLGSVMTAMAMAMAMAMTVWPLAAHADRWLIEDSVSTRFESNDNAYLLPVSAGRLNSLYVSGALDASHQLENSSTRLRTDATWVGQKGAAARNRVDGQLALTQAFSDPLDDFSLAVRYAQDFNNVVTSADVTQGQGRRRTVSATGLGSRALTERLSASLQIAADRTDYGSQLASAVGYRDVSASAGVLYALSEVMKASAQLERSDYRASDDRTRSDTDSFNLGLSRTLSARSNVSLSVGTYRTATSARLTRVSCPLAVPFCNAGLVPFVIEEQQQTTVRRGLQFNASYRLQVDEITDASFSVGRQQVPSGAGTLVRSETLTLGSNRNLSPTLVGSVSYARSRSTYQQATAAPSPTQSTLAVSFARQLTPDLSLQAAYRRDTYDDSAFDRRARSNAVSITLKLDGPKVDARR